MNFFTRNITTINDTVSHQVQAFVDVITNENWNDISFTGINALKNADILTSLQMISSDIAGLKVKTIQESHDDLLKLLNNKPNDVMNGYNLKYAIVANLILDGNVFVEITRNDKGRAIKLDLIKNSDVTVKVVKDNKYVKEVYYGVATNDSKTRKVKSLDMMHFKMNSIDGIVGNSVLRALQTELNIQNNSQSFLNNFFKNGTHAGGLLKAKDSGLSDEDKLKLKNSWQKANAGMNNANSVVVIDEDIDYQPLEIDTELIKMVNSNNTSTKAIAQVLGIPLHKLGISTSNMDLSQLNQDYLISTLKSYIDIILSELYKLDHNMNIDFDFNVDAYKNIDAKQLRENLKLERELGFISVNEGRRALGLPPIDDEIGNQYITNLNFVDSSIAKEYQLNKDKNEGGVQVDD